jgi:predicted regulator of Ras-like GTPase activity (Roadblock/LC7/MglB family)
MNALEHTLNRIHNDLSARSVVLIREDGQVIGRQGTIDDDSVAPLAALVAAMAAASQSVAKLAQEEPHASRLSLEFPTSGLYAVAVDAEHWLAVLYEQALNPGLVRMQIRRAGAELSRLQFTDTFMIASPGAPASSKLTPLEDSAPKLFENITDAEIDGLFGRSL